MKCIIWRGLLRQAIIPFSSSPCLLILTSIGRFSVTIISMNVPIHNFYFCCFLFIYIHPSIHPSICFFVKQSLTQPSPVSCLLYSQGWAGISDSPASTFQVLRLEAFATMSGSCNSGIETRNSAYSRQVLCQISPTPPHPTPPLSSFLDATVEDSHQLHHYVGHHRCADVLLILQFWSSEPLVELFLLL